MHNQAPTQPPQPDQYAFLNNHGNSPKKSWLPKPSTPKGRALLVAGLFGLLITIAIIVFAVLGSLNAGKQQQWLAVAQKQQELIRISELGLDGAQSSQTKSLAINVKLTLSSSQSSINSLVSKSGAEVSSKTLGLAKDPKVDSQLESATQTNQFDETFEAIIKDGLVEYQVLLKAVFDQAKNPNTQDVLRSAYDNAELLTSQANQ